MLTTYHKQHSNDLTEIEILQDDTLLATVTVSHGWVDITYEKNVHIQGDSYTLLKVEDNGTISVDKPTLE